MLKINSVKERVAHSTNGSQNGSQNGSHNTLRKRIALIPAYNEARFIGSVVLQTLSYVDQVVVVDDGSTDKTA